MILSIKTIPNAKKSEIVKLDEDRYKIRLDVQPIHSEANNRLIELLSDHFNVPESSIIIIKGHKSREKIVKII